MAMKRRGKDPESDFTFQIRRVFRSDRVDEQNTMDLMVIVWTRCGKPVLEKRRVWTGKKGSVRLRKLVGMNAEDVNFILTHAEEIQQLLKS